MTEEQIGYLYNLAAALPHSETNTILKSYYLMRCQQITRGRRLPNKHFSLMKRCQKCCLEWKNDTIVQVRTIKLSRKKRLRMKRRKDFTNGKDVLNTNEIVKVCSFCKNSTITTALKPQKEKLIHKKVDLTKNMKGSVNDNVKEKSAIKTTTNVQVGKKTEVNVYSNAFDIFSLKNKNNTLASTIKEQPKVIKNNKKKKDKFAGLCQKAVLASAKMKEDKIKLDKIQLFLKPSSK